MRMVDVCAGIGGFSLAATWAGYEVAGQVEIDPWCRRVLAKHWPDALRVNDVFEVRGDEFGPIDLLTAGIPCQPYSVAGKRLGSGDDRALWPAVRSIIAVAQPHRVLIENVGGYINMALDETLSDLEAEGYEVGAVVLPACAVGASHERSRVWILGNAVSIGQPGPWAREHAGDQAPDREGQAGDVVHAGAAGTGPETLGGMDCEVDGLPGLLARSGWRVGPDVLNPWAGDWEGDISRTTTHEQDRTHKLKALGNAVVPQVAYEILRAWGCA